MRAEGIDHDFNAQKSVLLILDFEQLDHQFQYRRLVLAKRLGMRQPLQKGQEVVAQTLRSGEPVDVRGKLTCSALSRSIVTVLSSPSTVINIGMKTPRYFS